MSDLNIPVKQCLIWLKLLFLNRILEHLCNQIDAHLHGIVCSFACSSASHLHMMEY